MTDDPIHSQTQEQAREELRRLFGEIEQLSRQDLAVEDYFQQLLGRVVTALAAAGGVVWTRGPSGEAEQLCQENLHITELAEGGKDEDRHARLLQQVLAQGESLIVPPYAGDDDVGNPTRFLLLLVPLRIADDLGADGSDEDGSVEGVVEIFQRPGAAIEVQRRYLKFLHGVVEKAGDWMRRREFRQLTDQQSHWQQLDAFSQAAHESLNGRETAFAVSNEARLLLGCDRVSVALRRGSSFRLKAVSGQDTMDRRSNLVVLLEKLVRRVLSAGEPLWYCGNTEDLPPQIEEALQTYVDFAHSKTVGVIPLRRVEKVTAEPDDNQDEAEIVGALIVEQIEDNRALPVLQQRTSQIATHAARAVTNAYDYESLFLMPLWRAIGHSRVLVQARHLPKTLLAAAALLIAVLVCIFVKIDFNLEGTAELQPVERRNVFAGVQGVVTKVHVDTGDRVGVGDTLLTLRNTDLLVQIEDLQGRSSVASEEILEYERRLLGRSTSSVAERARWASELASVRKQYANYETQLKLLRKQEERLTIDSPIAGEVITWDARRVLHNRPVVPGQVLLTVANTQGEWELLIHMPEDNIGYIADAQDKSQEKLDVTYIMATDPGNKRAGKLRSVHLLAETHETAGHSVTMAVDIDKNDLQHPRPGATATAQAHCGPASIAFVWLHDVVEFLQTKVFF